MLKGLTGTFEYQGFEYAYREPTVAVVLEAALLPEVNAAILQLEHCLTSVVGPEGNADVKAHVQGLPVSQFKGLVKRFAAELDKLIEADPL